MNEPRYYKLEDGEVLMVWDIQQVDAPPRPNPYWGCTCLSGCDYGFGGTEEDLPRQWNFCPCCGGELTEITSHRKSAEPGL